MRNLMHRYPKTTAYIAVMVTLLFFMQVWELTQ